MVKVSIVCDISETIFWNDDGEEMNVSPLGVLELLCTLLAIDLLYGVSAPIARESMDEHLLGKLMLISDCKTDHTKLYGMYFNTQILINGDTAHFLSWMTLGTFERYINMEESQIRSDSKIDILPYAC